MEADIRGRRKRGVGLSEVKTPGRDEALIIARTKLLEELQAVRGQKPLAHSLKRVQATLQGW